jgi:CRISPR/Cas system endoribonuclease Cas6 (RAMP superfamily)
MNSLGDYLQCKSIGKSDNFFKNQIEKNLKKKYKIIVLKRRLAFQGIGRSCGLILHYA